MPKKLAAIGRCPRCGASYFSSRVKYVNGRAYVYAYHGRDSSGRPVYCYVGPADGYEAVSGVKGAVFANIEGEGLAEVISLLSAIVARKQRTMDSDRKAAGLRELAAELRHIAELASELAARLEAEAELYARVEQQGGEA